MIASLVCLVAGGALFGVSLSRQVFARFVGPALNAQYRFQRRLPNVVQYSESSFFNTGGFPC